MKKESVYINIYVKIAGVLYFIAVLLSYLSDNIENQISAISNRFSQFLFFAGVLFHVADTVFIYMKQNKRRQLIFETFCLVFVLVTLILTYIHILESYFLTGLFFLLFLISRIVSITKDVRKKSY